MKRKKYQQIKKKRQEKFQEIEGPKHPKRSKKDGDSPTNGLLAKENDKQSDR